MKLIDADKLKQMLAKQYEDTVELIRNGETHLDSLAEGYTECAQMIEKLILFENADKYRCKNCAHCRMTIDDKCDCLRQGAEDDFYRGTLELIEADIMN